MPLNFAYANFLQIRLLKKSKLHKHGNQAPSHIYNDVKKMEIYIQVINCFRSTSNLLKMFIIHSISKRDRVSFYKSFGIDGTTNAN